MTKILVIDDDDGVREILARMLRSAGFEVTVAKDGRDGLARFHSDCPDVVLTDVIMPDQDGIDTIIALRKVSRTVPIIAVSGGGRTHTMQFLEVARKLGADLILPKPVKQQQLVEAILQLVEGKPDRRKETEQ